MKVKIISFFSILFVSIAIICSITAFAANSYYVSGTSANFAKNYSTSVTKISSWKRVGTVQSISNDHNGRYKSIKYTTYKYDADIGDFIHIDDAYKEGKNRQLDAAVDNITGVTNCLAYGKMGKTNSSSGGTEEYLIINVRNSTAVPYLYNAYLP